MAGSGVFTEFFTQAMEKNCIVYVETLTSSVRGYVMRVLTDGVDILRSENIITAISFDKIQIAEEITPQDEYRGRLKL